MLPNRLSTVFIYVSDMERSVRFYRDTLGLPLRFQSEHWSEFETETVTLALHAGGTPKAGGDGAAEAGTVRFGWGVEDIDAVCDELKRRGVRFIMEPQAREGEPIRL